MKLRVVDVASLELNAANPSDLHPLEDSTAAHIDYTLEIFVPDRFKRLSGHDSLAHVCGDQGSVVVAFGPGKSDEKGLSMRPEAIKNKAVSKGKTSN